MANVVIGKAITTSRAFRSSPQGGYGNTLLSVDFSAACLVLPISLP